MNISQPDISQRLYTLLLLFLSAVLPGTSLFGQVKFSAVCPDKKVGKNEYLHVQYLVENASRVDQIVPPPFKDFSVVSGPNQQSGMSNINGNIKQYIALEFILKPLRPGKFTLPAATARADGKNLLSNSIAVEVTNSSSASPLAGNSFSPLGNIFTDVFPSAPVHQYDDYILQKKENVADKIKKNLFVNVTVNKTTCYVGEPVVASYKLYTRLKSESNLTKSPSFNGFSVTEMEMPDNYSLGTEKLNGREYSVYTLRKVQLYPLQPGTVQLEPIEVENNVTFIKAEYANANKGDIFYDMMRDFADASAPRDAIEVQKVTIASKPVDITIKPLPELNQPKDFKGAVGSFNIEAALSKKNMTVDEAGNLSIKISGNGNIQMINAPDIQWPEGIEAFEPKSSQTIDKTAVPLKGQKTFNYAFTFQKQGTYVIPPVTFSYFDIRSDSYKTISTHPLTVKIKHGNKLKRAIANFSGLKDSKLQTFTEKIIALRWMMLAVLLILVTIWWLAIKGRKFKKYPGAIRRNNITTKVVAPVNTVEEPIIANPLYEAEAMLGASDANGFYHAINNCLRKYLAAKLKFPETELGRKKINELLDKRNVAVSTTVMLTTLLENIELNLYAPLSSPGEVTDTYEKAVEVIGLLDKQL